MHACMHKYINGHTHTYIHTYRPHTSWPSCWYSSSPGPPFSRIARMAANPGRARNVWSWSLTARSESESESCVCVYQNVWSWNLTARSESESESCVCVYQCTCAHIFTREEHSWKLQRHCHLLHAYIYIYKYIHTYIDTHACIYIYIDTHACLSLQGKNMAENCRDAVIYYMHIYIYIYIYIYKYIHTYIDTH